MKKQLLSIILMASCILRIFAQQCLSGGCTSFTSEYPSSGAPYTPTTSWQVLINPATGNVANFNGGNWTRFNVVSGNTYEWTYCEAYGGVSTSWDAQLTLSNNNSPTTPICFSTDVCGTNQNAPYISWTATFTGTVRLLTTAYVSGVGGCQSNSSSPYNKLAYRQVSTSCITPGIPSSATATPSGQTTANLSWTTGSPSGSSTVTYYWVVGTSSSVTYGNGVAQGSTTGTSAIASGLSCNTTYYLRVYAKTNCDNSSSGYKTSSSFTTSACVSNSLYGVDVSNYNGTINWHQVYLAGKSFAYVKATEGFTGNDAQFNTSMTSSNPDGVVLGPYHLARPDNQPGTAGAIQEANHFLSIAGSYIGSGFLPPALDMESLFSTSALGIAQWVNAWATTVQASKGVWPVLYIARCDASSLLPYYQNGTIDSHIKLWIADTGNPAGSPANTANCIWNSWQWIFHQYWWPCNACASNNPTTGMDLDIFNGDLTAFNNLINVSTTCSDQFESNNSANTATLVFANPLNSSSSNYSPQANIGFAGDQDWYRVNIQACGTLTVNLSNLPLNYDLELWNSSATTALSGSYNAGTSNEQVTYTSSSSTLSNVYVKVYANSSSNFTTASCYKLQFLWSPGNCPCTPPTASISPSTATICNGGSIQLTASGGTSYAWSNGATTSAITVSPTSNTTYTVTVTNSSGCTATASRLVSVNSSPSASISPSSVSICIGGSIQLTASGGTSYAWSNGATTSAITVSPSANTTYTVTATNSNGCSASANRLVSVSSAPTASISPSTANICSGNSIQLTASGGNSYSWSNGATTASITVSPNTNTTYTVTVSNSGCSATATASRTVTVNQTPSVSINPPSVSICSGGSGTTLQATGSAQNYTWSPSTGLNTTTGQTVTANPFSNTTYTVTATNGNCSATATSVVTVSNQITASISPANPVVCGNGSVVLSATPGTAYTWSGPNSFSGNTQSVSVSSGGSYSVTVTNPGGCVGNATASITVSQNPVLVVDAGTNQIIQQGDSAQLGGTPTANGGTLPYTYLWNPTTALDNSNTANPYSNPTTGNISYSLTVTDSKGCSATDNISVTVSTGCQTFLLDSLSMSIPSDSATYSINLTTGAGCPWTVIEGCSWLSFNNTTGNGTTSLAFIVAENVLTSPRTCYVNIEGNILIITQAPSAACLAPVSDFNATQQAGFAPFSVTFNDISTNTPTQWEWTFSGGDISTSSVQNPTVNYTYGGLFDVTLKATNACGSNTVTKTNYINVIGTVGIDNLAASENINIFPNPNKGTFKISAEINTTDAIELKLFSAVGQLIYSSHILPNNNKIDKDISIANAPSGIYIIQLLIDKKPHYGKLIIE